MKEDTNNFGFSAIDVDPWTRIGQPALREYRSSIDIDPLGLDIEKILSDAAINLAYRANKLREQKGWSDDDVSFVLTLTFVKGKKRHSDMSLKQECGSPHQKEDVMDNVIEIHPDDFAELLYLPTMKQIDSCKTIGDELFECDGKIYHRTATAPRTAGEHFII